MLDIRMLAVAFVLCPVNALSQTEHLALRSWDGCSTIEKTSDMLTFEGMSAECKPIKAGTRVIVERVELVPARRWMCIDHPAGKGTFTLCGWHSFQDEPATWLCARVPGSADPCRWGPKEYFSSERTLATGP